ncbi:hypothetical protein KFE25_011336 [Diacronema lutheri]|uniref:Uncharacterized protein n=1 Tax=Diacronema lutheri TaxID=2081491 RepID=A0A8J5X8J9_DIALT|nr:hypothetical protein KFE25_011336 [Diacronema lutheri]|mmetsp:Transcript_10686/g.33692  ORF Transcript_10686/g.33692 Transcript_10686/m.33692 type:complete len:134 (+) Transcript_10686:1004-1405(+)
MRSRPLLRHTRYAKPALRTARAVARTSARAVVQTSAAVWAGALRLACERPLLAGIAIGVAVTLAALAVASAVRGRRRQGAKALAGALGSLVHSVLSAERAAKGMRDDAIAQAIEHGARAMLEGGGQRGRRRRT